MSFPFVNPRSVADRHFNVAYITSEIALAQEIASYSGGLGIVAGSYMNAFEDLSYPAIAVSLYPSHGYVQQRFNQSGNMVTFYQPNPCPDALHDTGLRLKLKIGERDCMVAILLPRDRDRIHTGVVYLTTDIEENPEDFRMISRALYGKRHASEFFSKDSTSWHEPHWLEVYQDFILGIGGYYALKLLGVDVDLYHLNDSHGAFLALHLYGQFRDEGYSVEEAKEKVRKIVRYTNHTLVAAGNATLNMGIVSKVGENYIGLSAKYVHEVTGRDWEVPMSPICMELSGRQSGVSKLHAELLSRLYNRDILANTNGVYVPMFQHPECAKVDRWQQIPEVKQYLKDEAYHTLIRRVTEANFEPINMSYDRFMKALSIFVARRKAKYKRHGLIFHNEERALVELLLKWEYITIWWGGKVHPDDDDEMRDWNRRWQQIRKMPGVCPVMNYDLELMSIAKYAADIWLQLMMQGHEASGTSGLIAALNLALNVSIFDGVYREMENIVIYGTRHSPDSDVLLKPEDERWHAEYQQDAKALWQKLFTIIPRLRDGDPELLELILKAKFEVEEKYSAIVPARRYIDDLYPPLAA